MTTALALPAHDAAVLAAFEAQQARFKTEVPPDDVRLAAVLDALGPVAGRRVLDLGCGKGRFAAHLAGVGAQVVGLDLSAAMLSAALGRGFDPVRASARRLPFADASFDAVVAIEVIEHLSPEGLDDALAESARVLRPGGVLAIVDKNAACLNARRPWLPGLAVKWIDEHRGRWMYPANGPARERWFWPASLRHRLGQRLSEVRVVHLLSCDEAGLSLFRRVPAARRMVLWSARKEERRARDHG